MLSSSPSHVHSQLDGRSRVDATFVASTFVPHSCHTAGTPILAAAAMELQQQQQSISATQQQQGGGAFAPFAQEKTAPRPSMTQPPPRAGWGVRSVSQATGTPDLLMDKGGFGSVCGGTEIPSAEAMTCAPAPGEQRHSPHSCVFATSINLASLAATAHQGIRVISQALSLRCHRPGSNRASSLDWTAAATSTRPWR